jgi:hypothetical protein
MRDFDDYDKKIFLVMIVINLEFFYVKDYLFIIGFGFQEKTLPNEMSRQIHFVRRISSLFGVYYKFSESDSLLPKLLCSELLIIISNLCFIPFLYKRTFGMSNVFFIIYTIQWMLPLMNAICISLEAYRKRSIESKIVSNFAKLEKIVSKNFGSIYLKEVKIISFKFVTKLMILLIVRALHMKFSNIYLSLTLMITELVCAVSDFMFTFYVNLLQIQIKKYTSDITPLNIKKLKVHEEAMVFYKLSKLLCQRYSIALFVNISFNFILLIIGFYWIFIRIAFNHLKLKGMRFQIFCFPKFLLSFPDFVTFIYLIQPIMNLWSIFNSCQECSREVG